MNEFFYKIIHAKILLNNAVPDQLQPGASIVRGGQQWLRER